MNIQVALVASLIAAATASGQAFAWRRAQVDYLGPCSIAYDSARDRLVAFAGELHEWDGGQWVRRSVAHPPSPTSDSQLAYDSLRRRLVLLQQVLGNSLQVYEFDGDDWVQPATGPIVPPPRTLAAAAFDPARGMVVVFGGRVAATQALGDTWGWNGTSWIQLASTGPTPRGSAAMAFHPPTGRLVLYGGDVGGNETWTFDGVQWLQVTPTTNPPSFFQHRMASDPTTGTVWMHDGASRATWSWNGTDWSADASLAQVARTDFGLAADRNGPVVGGGTLQLGLAGGLLMITAQSGDAWRLSNGAWTRLADGGPRLVNTGVCAFDENRGRMMVLDATSNLEMRTWEWNGTRWIDTDKVLAVLTGMATCFDPFRGRILGFGGLRVGGLTFATALTDLQSWDGANWTTIGSPVTPPGRWNAAMAFDPLRGEVVMHGGTALNQQLADTWAWNGFAWRQLAAGGTPPRSLHAMAYEQQSGGILMFGGVSGTSVTSDTWRWDGTTWTQLLPANVPPARSGHRLVSSLFAPLPTIIGGTGLSDRWQWIGSDWQRLTSDLPLLSRPQANPVLAAIDNNGNTIFLAEDTTWLGGTSVATISNLGPGCSNGPALRPLGEPVLGNAGFAVDLRRAPTGVPYVLAAGVGVASVPIGTCRLLLPTIDFAVGGTTSANGDDSVRLPVPDVASLLGVEFSMQAAVLDPPSALGFTLSDGLPGRLGR